MDGATAFEDLTLGEVEEICATCLGGKVFSDPTVDPMALAGAVMWMHHRRTNGIAWDEFKRTTTMREIRLFSEEMNRQETANPTNAHYAPAN